MKQIVSKRTKKIQIIPEEVWDNIVARGWKNRYDVTDLPELRLKKVPTIEPPEEVKQKRKKNETN